jgi:hypothetical protein
MLSKYRSLEARSYHSGSGHSGSGHSGSGEPWRPSPGELVVPQGTEHQPVARVECEVMLIEPETTLDTGSEVNERMVAMAERLA